MAQAAIIDIDRLLAPIADQQPTGVDCRTSTPPCQDYWAVRDARNRARAIERKNLFESQKQDVSNLWRQVAASAESLLLEQSKDLEVACWLTEALVRLQGFAGLRDAFELLDKLVGRYWDELHPLADEDGTEIRVMPLTGLNGDSKEGVLLAAIRTCSLTGYSNADCFSYWHYQQAREAERLAPEQQQKRIASLGYDLADVRKAMTDAEPMEIALLRANIVASREQFQSLNRQLESLCGMQLAPPSSAIVNLLSECLDALDHLTDGQFAQRSAAEASAAPPQSAQARQALGKSDFISELARLAEQWRFAEPDCAMPFLLEQILAEGKTGGDHQFARRQAFSQLARIADYFRVSEPHSPIPYLLARVQRWGAMPLADLIEELIPNEAAYDHFRTLTGVTKQANHSTNNGG